MNLFRVALVFTLILVFTTPEGLDSCGIAAPEPVFIVSEGPPNRAAFLDGKLGVLRQSFEPRNLIAAFRILSGVPLTPAEKDSLYKEQLAADLSARYPPQEWSAARRAVAGAGSSPEVNPYGSFRGSGLILNFENCKKDAFLTAKATLDELSKTWGNSDPRLVDWIHTQDQVFSNCSALTPNIPAAPEPDADPLLASHRRYQIAAALFYAGQFRKAAAAFEEIAQDHHSPWREYAPYLAGRALLRAGLIDGDMDAFRDGRNRLLAVMKDPGLKAWREPAEQLVELWRIRVEPLQRADELSRQLMTPDSKDISQSVIDLLYLVRNRVYGGSRPWSKAEVSEVEQDSELAAWLLSMSSAPPADAGVRALEWWRKHHNPAWLIAGLVNGADQDVPELITAAEGFQPASPGFESVAYHAVVRATRLREYARAARLADRALRLKLDLTSRNAFLQARLPLANNLEEFLRFGERKADPSLGLFEAHEVEVHPEFYRPPEEIVLDWDGVDAFNIQLPLSLWLEASQSRVLPAQLKLRIAEAGWMRALVLGRNNEARKFMQQIVALNPAVATVAANYLSPEDPRQARFGAIYIVLRTPGLAPSLGAPGATTPDLSLPRNYYTGGGWYHFSPWDYSSGSWRKPSTNPLRFLTAADRTAAAADWSKVHASTPWNAAYLLRETLEWSKLHPEDKRVPEALHRAIQASFFRPGGENMGKYSKQAWEMLHQRFPNSPWTARSPYWYQ